MDHEVKSSLELRAFSIPWLLKCYVHGCPVRSGSCYDKTILGYYSTYLWGSGRAWGLGSRGECDGWLCTQTTIGFCTLSSGPKEQNVRP